MNTVLVGDIGGTNCRFALIKGTRIIQRKNYKSKEITDFTKIVLDFLATTNQKIDAACFAVAGPVIGKKVKLTNQKWSVDVTQIKRRVKLGHVFLINDLEAIAYGTLTLKKSQVLEVQKAKTLKNKPIAVIGAGTGLGKAILVYEGKGWVCIPSEGGHGAASFLLEEVGFQKWLAKQGIKMPEWEDVVSGVGISTIYQYFSKKYPKNKVYQQIKTNNFSPALISKNRNKDPHCRETFNWFSQLYARCAKNFALDTLCFGGLYIAGGIAPKNLEIFKAKTFKDEFISSHKHKKLLKQIPIKVIKDYDVSLFGAANYIKRILSHL